MEKNIVIISKDVLRPDYLGCYGNKQNRTPNIDRLAETGTLFTNFYSPAGSSAMAYSCMFTGLDAFELGRGKYVKVGQFGLRPTLFEVLERRGYRTHVVWDEGWQKIWRLFSMVYSEKTEFHPLDLATQIGPHRRGKVRAARCEEADPSGEVIAEFKKILGEKSVPHFVWFHCPHVLRGMPSYGSDIEKFDGLVGEIAAMFERDGVYFMADHGHFIGEKGKMCYGFDVYEPVLRVPFITPDFLGRKVVDDPLSLVQLPNIILERKLRPQEFVYSDSQYFQQPDRKLMIRKGSYKYIFNKRDRSEELYDLDWDPGEKVNLLAGDFYDFDRRKVYYLDEVVFYKRWDEAHEAYLELKREKERIWQNGSRLMGWLLRLNKARKTGLRATFRDCLSRKRRFPGRWGARPKAQIGA